MKQIAIAICLLLISVAVMVYLAATNEYILVVIFSAMIFVTALALLIGAAKNYGKKLGSVVSRDELLLRKGVYVVEAAEQVFAYWPDFPRMQKNRVLVLLRSLSDGTLCVCYTRDILRDFQVKITNGRREYVPWYPSWST